MSNPQSSPQSKWTRRGEHPGWSDLLEHRFDPSLPEPADWEEALAHLDECPDCLADAVEIDPTLAFRRLPEVEIDDREIEAMQESVAVLRRGHQVLEAEAHREVRSGGRGRWFTAAALAVGMGLSLTGGGVPSAPVGPMAEAPLGTTLSAASMGRAAEADFELPFSRDRLIHNLDPQDLVEDLQNFNDPVVEGVENPAARVYQFRTRPDVAEDETIAVAFVIDPSIDV